MNKLLDAIKVGIILVDENYQLCFSNQRARNIIENSHLFQLDQYNRICIDSTSQSQLEALLNNILSKGSESLKLAGVLHLTSPQNEKFMLTVSPFNNWGKLDIENVENRHFAAIFITRMQEKHQLAMKYLKDNYSLSPRECEVCELFVNGYSFEDISEVCHLSIASVRTYFKSIYLKLSCSSQAELMYKLISMTINFQHIE